MNEKHRQITESIARRQEWLCSLSDQIWDHPELCFEETFSSALLIGALRQEGFRVTENLAGIPTAFSGSWGSGKPVIGILGEFDALAGMSQQADVAEPRPIVPGANGHGCGHNLLGVGSLAAAIAVKDYMEANGTEGTVIYFGCPAEEGGAGKAFMARDGAFDDLDAAITWHPGDITAAVAHSSLANEGVIYRFTGRSAHASAVPHEGRSALDALTLLNTGVQFLREHVPEKTRIHYAVLDAGGTAPNVVQATSAAYYLVRHPDLEGVHAVRARVDDVARGAALMTGTTVEIQYIKGCANVIPSLLLSKVLTENLQGTAQPVYTEEDYAYAKRFEDTVSCPDRLLDAAQKYFGGNSKLMALAQAHADEPIHSMVVPCPPTAITTSSSTDVGDVSWICPTGEAQVSTNSANAGSHTWQRTAQGKSALAHQGMLFAGRGMAGAVIDLLTNPALLAEAKKEWEGRMAGRHYIPIPKDVNPMTTKDYLNPEP